MSVEQRRQLVVFWESFQRLFGESEFAINDNLKYATATFDQFDFDAVT